MISFLAVGSGYMIQNGDNLMIKHFIGIKELGIYNAYYTLAKIVTAQIATFFIAAYFPALVKAGNKEIILKKIDKLSKIVAIPWIFLNTLFMFVGIKFYGHEYILDWKTVLLFSFYALFYLYGILYGYVVLSNKDNNIIKRLYTWWLLIVLLYFLILFILSYIINLTVNIILIVHVLTLGVNVFLNRHFCFKIIK